MRKHSKMLRHVQIFYVKSRGIGQFENGGAMERFFFVNHYKDKPLFGALSLLRNGIGMVTFPRTRQELQKGRNVLCVLPFLMQLSQAESRFKYCIVIIGIYEQIGRAHV